MKPLIEMARIAGVRDDGHRFEFSEYKYLERFTELVRADEREQIGKRAMIAMLGSDRELTLRLMNSIKARMPHEH